MGNVARIASTFLPNRIWGGCWPGTEPRRRGGLAGTPFAASFHRVVSIRGEAGVLHPVGSSASSASLFRPKGRQRHKRELVAKGNDLIAEIEYDPGAKSTAELIAKCLKSAKIRRAKRDAGLASTASRPSVP